MAEKVLVVDDEKIIVTLMEKYLAPAGYEVLTAYNGEDAIRIADEFKPDAILLDIMLPGINGYDVTARLKGNRTTNLIPIILITGVMEIENKVRGLDAGADDFIIKPVNRIELLARVRSLIKLKKVQEELEENARLSQTILSNLTKDYSLCKDSIMIAGSDGRYAERLRDAISHADYECHISESGLETMSILNAKIPNIILIDMPLPDMEGFELLRKIKENPETEDISVIFVSNDESPEAKVKGLDAGVDDYLSRAVNFNEMLARVKASLRRNKARKRLKLEADTFFRQSITDSLTGLYNRRYIADLMERQLKLYKRHKRSFSVMMLDIDYFKNINDTFGHVTGDGVLKELGKVLKENTRSSDIVSRYGGEEFVILLYNTNIEGARISAERIRACVDGYIFPDIGDKKITVSIGVSEVGSEDDTNSIMKKVDNALYRAKNNGRNIVGQY